MYHQKMVSKNSASDVAKELNKAAAGLLYQSEADYPFETVRLDIEGKPTAKDILALRGYAPRTPVKTEKLEQFFSNAVKEEDWHNTAEKRTVKKFRQFVETLKANLEDIKVFKVGKIEIDAYVIGKAGDGTYVGVSTKVIET